jgi:hypothetical protein
MSPPPTMAAMMAVSNVIIKCSNSEKERYPSGMP